MPYCPKCDMEFVEGITKCSDCGGPLFESKEAAEEMLDYKGTGMSVMEMSHRSSFYEAIIQEAEADLRKLMNIPDNYKIYFVGGGASTQFFHIPANFLGKKAGYVNTGVWTKKAIKEAKDVL